MTVDYKATLNLPATDFPMKANLPQREPQQLAQWASIGVYEKLRTLRKGAPRFILHDGPPYANGTIHIGHAVNKILKDFIIKSKGLDGLDAPYVPGWDCHGLPIELMVEKKVGKPGVKIDAGAFRAACRSYADAQVQAQCEDFIRLGVFGDFGAPYRTMDFKFEADIVRSLGKIHQNGHLIRGAKPVHWCIDCGSALAEAEVEYENRTSPAIDVRFKVASPETLKARLEPIGAGPGAGPLSIVIWTTTPWTLPANQAVALGPDVDYVVIETPDSREQLIVAEALLEAALQRWDLMDARRVGRVRGAALEGLALHHPFYPREVPVILGDHVTLDAGTGAVHTAPGHGQEDYVVGQRYHLPIDNPVGDNGRFLPSTPLFAGEAVLTVNGKVIDVLIQHGTLMHEARIEHSYPHCWRHKTPIIFRATPQWFIAMDHPPLRPAALATLGAVEFIPEWGRARIQGMVEGRPDWCVSRQRNWGVPLPLFVHRDTQTLHPETPRLIEAVAALIETRGIDAWFDLEPERLLGEEAKDYRKVTDTLDVWFDSGVTHACVLTERDGLSFPADLYLEGSDQHRGWFQSSLMASVAMTGKAPYRAVLTHGFVVDAEGKKMSKSKGNVVAPQKVMQTLGADVLRLWVAATDYRQEMHVSDEILKRTADVYRRLRNTARYLLANLKGFDPQQHQVATEALLPLDRWVIDRARRLQDEVKDAYTHYQFHTVFQRVHHFCSVDLGSFYLDVLKDRQYTCREDSIARRSGQTAMYHLAEALTRWLAPILSFTAEEIWQHLPGPRSESVFLETWYEALAALPEDDPYGPAFWEEILMLRDTLGKSMEILRSQDVIGASLDAEATLAVAPSLYSKLAPVAEDLRFLFINSGTRVIEAPELQGKEGAERVRITVTASSAAKCIRCWQHRPEVGTHREHPALCGRCIDNLEGPGETRRLG